jgi:uncharacterized membrane protein (DUF4010 family)
MFDLIHFLVVSAGLGALIGLIRQWSEQTNRDPDDFAGVRTHTLWSLLGCLGAFATEAHTPYALAIVLLAVAAHLIARAMRQKEETAPGTTSFAGALLTVFCGALVFWEETKSAIVVAAATMVLLGIKQPIHAWTRQLKPGDIRAMLQFVAVSGVILPLVPNRDMGPFDAFNPYSTWLMVVLISGIGFAGYVAVRLIGSHAGILVSGLLGGLASSTASTLAFSRRSREEPALSEHYALAVAAACTVMLPRVLVATGFINRALALQLALPFALMALPAILYSAWVWWRRRPTQHKGDLPPVHNPLSLATAIKFAALYAVIAFAVKAVREQGWTDGLMPLAFISGLTDMDAISLSVAREKQENEAAVGAAARLVMVAAIANTLIKAGMAVALGSPGLRWRIGAVLGATTAIGIGWVLIGR